MSKKIFDKMSNVENIWINVLYWISFKCTKSTISNHSCHKVRKTNKVKGDIENKEGMGDCMRKTEILVVEKAYCMAESQ